MWTWLKSDRPLLQVASACGPEKLIHFQKLYLTKKPDGIVETELEQCNLRIAGAFGRGLDSAGREEPASQISNRHKETKTDGETVEEKERGREQG
ncbi:hypothetical protein DPEC_G00152370 [Dallia pectoralis]|uniref:Uncharacterized protein n=1 Tax=Dallia pectoralis TaxID=75939 RepID=A0ACC2GK25_DALPE|nr:hypothetical protein DPEC_G00152370 [Dallia pectoralis]